MDDMQPKIDSDGNKFWYLNGNTLKLHRADGPAVEMVSGRKDWYLDGDLRRTEWGNGGKEWWLRGRRHRTDGPAIDDADGSKQWFVNGELHRTDGPAIEWSDGGKEWCLNNEIFSFNEWLNQNHELTDEEKVMMKLKYG
jgi:hypothetical protein